MPSPSDESPKELFVLQNRGLASVVRKDVLFLVFYTRKKDLLLAAFCCSAFLYTNMSSGRIFLPKVIPTTKQHHSHMDRAVEGAHEKKQKRKTLANTTRINKIKILYLASLFARMRASTEYSVGARAKSHTSLNHISMNTNTVLFFVFFFSSSS